MIPVEPSLTLKYRLIWWKRWPLLVLILITIETLRTFPELISQVFSSPLETGIKAFSFVSLFILILFGLLLLLVGELLLSYVEVSPTGLKIRLWPFFDLSCEWQDLEEIRQSRLLGILSYDVIVMAKTTRISFASTTVSKQNLLISDFQGWPRGQLASDIRQYAPRLFTVTGDLQSLN